MSAAGWASVFDQEVLSSWSRGALIATTSVAMVAGIIIYVRIVGLRSFSKMSSFDFIVTVAFGSLLAATVMSGTSLIEGLVAAGCLLGVQYVVAVGRSRFGWGAFIDNKPLMLMRNGELCIDNMARSRVTADDVRAKLRAANITNYAQVHAVVLETTGDVSVLHSPHGNFDEDLLADVRP